MNASTQLGESRTRRADGPGVLAFLRELPNHPGHRGRRGRNAKAQGRKGAGRTKMKLVDRAETRLNSRVLASWRLGVLPLMASRPEIGG
jgi:hypothetical protein